MLNHISWFTYAITVGVIAGSYYLYIAFTYYRKELKALIANLSGKRPALAAATGDFVLPEETIIGKAQSESVDFVAQEDLSFGPTDIEDNENPVLVANQAYPVMVNSHHVGIFSDMISEIKTLIRVINESGESKENFEMLFRLIILKYSDLAGTAYQTQINDFLLTEGAPEFPFPLTATDLENYWTEEIKTTAA
jgi:hypothetical protein